MFDFPRKLNILLLDFSKKGEKNEKINLKLIIIIAKSGFWALRL